MRLVFKSLCASKMDRPPPLLPKHGMLHRFAAEIGMDVVLPRASGAQNRSTTIFQQSSIKLGI